MIRHDDLVKELQELLLQLSKEKEQPQSNSNNLTRTRKQCETVIQQHKEYLSSTFIINEETETSNASTKLTRALEQIRLQLALMQQQNDSDESSKVVDAVEPLDSTDTSFQNMTVLQAYALYQRQQYDAVLDLLEDIEFESSSSNYAAAALHLQAQSYYNLHDMEGALALYTILLEESQGAENDDDDVHELYVNYMAAFLNQFTLPYNAESSHPNDVILLEILACVQKQQQDDAVQENETMMDLCYNAAIFQLLHRCNARDAKQFLLSRRRHRQDDINRHNQYEWSLHYWQGSMKGMRLQITNNAASSSDNKPDPWRLLQYYHDHYETLDELPQSNNNTVRYSLLQERLFHYNRCVALLHQKQYDACRAAIQELWETMAPEQEPEKDDPSLNDHVLLWWEVRLAVLLLYSPEISIDKSASQKKKSDSNSTAHKKQSQCLELRSIRALEFTLMSLPASSFRDQTLVYLQLHQAACEFPDETLTLNELYADWPPALRNKPAVQAMLMAQQQHLNQHEPSKESALEQGHWHSRQGNFKAAAECYEMALSHATDTEKKQIIQARLVQALTHVDPDRAMKMWKDMSVIPTHASHHDVQAMEAWEKNPLKGAAAIDKTVASHADDALNHVGGDTTVADMAKKSHDSVLTQRARRRAKYLKGLQDKGLYNPERPAQPDPERWIPKYDRAANRRRKKNHAPAQNKQHQGTGQISDKDLAKLDIAARQQQSKNLDSSTPSTAHMSASGVRQGRKRR